MTTALVIFAVIFILVIIYLASLEGQYNIDRSIVINASPEDTFTAVVDFKSWPEWSPWLLHEPQTRLIYSDNYDQENGFYEWDGKLVGAGKLTHLKITPLKAIQQKIEFLRPFKSVCSVSWTFHEVNGGTEVHWLMQGKMPFFFRFMTTGMIKMINRDYDLGLNLLNGYLNKDNPHPVITFKGIQELKGFQYTYITFKGHLNEMLYAIESGFTDLHQRIENSGVVSGKHLTIYRKADLDNLYFECEFALPIQNISGSSDLLLNSLPAGKYYQVDCLGDYQFLELLRYKAESHLKMLKLNIDKRRYSFEVYDKTPQQNVNTNEVRTTLYLPVK